MSNTTVHKRKIPQTTIHKINSGNSLTIGFNLLQNPEETPYKIGDILQFKKGPTRKVVKRNNKLYLVAINENGTEINESMRATISSSNIPQSNTRKNKHNSDIPLSVIKTHRKEFLNRILPTLKPNEEFKINGDNKVYRTIKGPNGITYEPKPISENHSIYQRWANTGHGGRRRHKHRKTHRKH